MLALLAGCHASAPPGPSSPTPPAHHEPHVASTIAGVPESGSLDGHYTFRRVYPGFDRAFRQTFDLTIDHGTARLHIVTADDASKRTNADIDRATFSGAAKTVDGTGTATLDPSTGELVLALSGGTHWICQRLDVQVAPADAHLTRPASNEDCLEDSAFEPPTTTAVHALSCRANGYREGPPPLRGDASRERRRDSDRWTFTPPPGLELLGDTCPARTGILRAVR